MFAKKVGKYWYACHNYNGTTKSFGSITEGEVTVLKAGKYPERLREVFMNWYYEEKIGTPYTKQPEYFLSKIKQLITEAEENHSFFRESVPMLCDPWHIQEYLNKKIKPIIEEWEKVNKEN